MSILQNCAVSISGTVVRSLLIGVMFAIAGNPPLRAQSEFGSPRLLTEINSPTTGEFSPSLSPNGLELFFMAYLRPGGFGDSDIWVARRTTVISPFAAPINLGPVVNAAGPESNPEISADGLTLYFDSQRPGGFGDRDLWMTTRSGLDDPWRAPVNLGSGVNTPGWEGRPTLPADGLTIVFDRDHERHLNTLQIATRPTVGDDFSGRKSLGIASADAGFSPDGLGIYFPGFIDGQVDLFYSTRPTVHDPFSAPQHLGGGVNSPNFTEVDSSFSFDGRELYFTRTTLDVFSDAFLSAADLWVSAVVPEPSSLFLVVCALAVAAPLWRRGNHERRRD